MQKLYLDCSAGISCSMLVGAFLELGVDEGMIDKAFASYNRHNENKISYSISKVKKGKCDATLFQVYVDGEDPVYDGVSETRNLVEIMEIIQSFELSGFARSLIKRIYNIIAGSEGTVQVENPGHAMFHAEGRLKVIADVVAFAVCYEQIEVRDVYVPLVIEGQGEGSFYENPKLVKAIAAFYNLPIVHLEKEGCLVTAAGVATLAAIFTDTEDVKTTNAVKGIGASPYDHDWPALVKAYLID